MVDRNLEGKLRAIQELKREKYIGTQQAWNYINRVAALYENPERVSRAINARLAEHGEVHYPATPERIVGLGYTIEEMFDKSSREFYNPNEDEGVLEEDAAIQHLDFDNPLFNCMDLIAGNKDERNPEKLVEYLTPLFLESQSDNLSNADFATNAVQYPKEVYVIGEDVRNDFFVKVSSADWDYLLSLENMRNIERRFKGRIFFSEIEINERVKLMLNDQIEHRLEYQREILTDLIDSRSMYDGETNYDDLSVKERKRFQTRKDRLIRLQNLNAPEKYIKSEKDLIRISDFFLRIIAPERNFINKYLRD